MVKSKHAKIKSLVIVREPEKRVGFKPTRP